MDWHIIGHEWAVNLLQNHVATGRVRHAYLFTGPDAVGKRTLALRFAQALNCEAFPATGETCGECRACTLIPRQEYPDLHVVEVGQLDMPQEIELHRHGGGIGQKGDPEETKRVSSKVKVKQVRLLQRQLALTPYEGRWRVAMLLRFWEASESAANALLKTLEEPAPQVVMLLTARSAESLLPTIVSRCEVIPLRALSRSELRDGLLERGEQEDRADLLAGLAAGRPGWALKFAQDPQQLKRRTDLLEDLFSLLSKSKAERFSYAALFRASKRENLQEVRMRAIETLETWLSLWRDVMIIAFDAEASSQNPDHQSELERLADSIRLEQVVSAVQGTARALQEIQHYVNIQLAIETLMLELPRIE
jgi:DNA polymerase-3 subunit delta'